MTQGLRREPSSGCLPEESATTASTTAQTEHTSDLVEAGAQPPVGWRATWYVVTITTADTLAAAAL